MRVVSEGSGLTETLLLPIPDDVLLLPCVDIKEAARMMGTLFPQSPVVTFTDFSILYHRIRLRTGRMSQSLTTINQMEFSPLVGALLEDTLTQCLYPAMPSANVLDQADDYLGLALDFAQFDNYPLAAIALAKARSALRAFECQPSSKIHCRRMDTTWASFAKLEQTLSSMAS